SVGILAPTGWVMQANAQYNAPPPAYSAGPAAGPSQTVAPSRRYARQANRRSARAPQPSGATASGPPPAQAYAHGSLGAQGSPARWEWCAPAGPNKRGNECVTTVDSTRGSGFRGASKKRAPPAPPFLAPPRAGLFLIGRSATPPGGR